MIDQEATKRFMAAPWLTEIDREIKLAILNALAEDRASTGAILLDQGHPNDHLTFLIDGTADIVRTFDNGRRETITTLTAPAVFGTTSFFQPKPPTVSVIATSDVWILTLYHPAYKTLRQQNPLAAEALAVAVVRALSERFDLIDKLFTEFTSQRPGAKANSATEWSRFRSRLFEERGI